jgi:uncharacterized protein (TIGR02266 family)
MTTPHQDPPAATTNPGQAKRAPIEQEMELKFPNFELLVTAMSANISVSGMFIQTTDPAPVGTTLSFRFRIEDWSPIQGTARVIWNRKHDEAPDRPAGMGVQLVDADAQSRRMIRYLVDKHLETGGEPFELGSATDFPDELPSTGPGTAQRPSVTEPQSNRILWGTGALLMVGVVAVGLWYQSTRPVSEEETPRPMVEGGQTAISGPVAAPARDEASDASEVTSNRRAEEAIEELVRDWSGAWETGQPDRLLAFYAPDFEPAGRETRAQWETRLEREMKSASFIRVAISALEISAPSATSGQATFFQSIRSDKRDETVETTLEVERSDDGWKITRQTTSR